MSAERTLAWFYPVDLISPEPSLFNIIPESFTSSATFYLETALMRFDDLKFTESLLWLAVASISLSPTFQEVASSPEALSSSSNFPSATDLSGRDFPWAEFFRLEFVYVFNDETLIPCLPASPPIDPDSCTFVLDL